MALNWTWRGNTSGIATSPVQSLPNVIESFSIVNKTGATVGVNVYIFSASASVSVCPNTEQIAVNTDYTNTRDIVLLASEQIKVEASGSVDYDFTLKNLNE